MRRSHLDHQKEWLVAGCLEKLGCHIGPHLGFEAFGDDRLFVEAEARIALTDMLCTKVGLAVGSGGEGAAEEPGLIGVH